MKRVLVTAAALAALAVGAFAVPTFNAVQLAGGTVGTPGGALATAAAPAFPAATGVADLAESATITRSQGSWHGGAGVNDGNAIPALINNAAGPLEALPNDFPTITADAAAPAVSVDFDLGAPANIDQIIIWSENNPDGRANSNCDILTSADGVAYTPLIDSVISDPDLLFPGAYVPVAGQRNGARVIVEDSLAGNLVTTRYVRVAIYAVSNTASAFWDEYNDPHPNDLDNQAAAFETPVIQEIEILGTTVPVELSVFSSN